MAGLLSFFLILIEHTPEIMQISGPMNSLNDEKDEQKKTDIDIYISMLRFQSFFFVFWLESIQVTYAYHTQTYMLRAHIYIWFGRWFANIKT